MTEQKQRRPRQAFFDVHAFLLRRIVCVDGMCYIALTSPFLCTFRDPFVLEPLPPTHYFPSPARKLNKREQQVRSPVQLLEGSQYASSCSSVCSPVLSCTWPPEDNSAPRAQKLPHQLSPRPLPPWRGPTSRAHPRRHPGRVGHRASPPHQQGEGFWDSAPSPGV